MPLVRYDELLHDARQRGYAVGAFNIFSMEFLPSILKAAKVEQSPVLLQVAPVHFHMLDLKPYLDYVKTQIAKTSVPVGLNMDHGTEIRLIFSGIQAGFPSVMFDGSRFDFDKNLQLTRRVVDICHSLDMTVEAELGTLNEEGGRATQLSDSLMTDPDHAVRFVKETQVDSLAVAIGNAHGVYKGEPKLDFARLQTIAERVDVPLVLHGGSGIADTDFQKAIRFGIAKINIYTEMCLTASKTLQSLLADSANQADYVKLLQKTREAVQQAVQRRMQVFGSSGKA